MISGNIIQKGNSGIVGEGVAEGMGVVVKVGVGVDIEVLTVKETVSDVPKLPAAT